MRHGDSTATDDNGRSEGMKWKPFNILAAMSMLLLAATLAIWSRSYLVRDEICWQRRSVQQLYSSDYGRIGYSTFQFAPDNGGDRDWTWFRIAPGRTVPVGRYEPNELIGIGWDVSGTMPYRDGAKLYSVTAREWWIPYRLIAALTALLPALWAKDHLLLQLRRRRWTRHGLCERCGYDLRASKDKCPECGTTIPPRPAAAAEGASP
jgi:hypothetical protein